MSMEILDCTLRDGGYINNWRFGRETIAAILEKLDQAGIDIIECGFLTREGGDRDCSLFSSLEAVETVLPRQRRARYVAMIAMGEKELEPSALPDNDGRVLQGIRLTFHKAEADKAFCWAKELMAKGYPVYLQPVGTVSYSDLELLHLVEKVNVLEPYAFYIVDTLGSMYRNQVTRRFHLLDENMAPGIRLGFHGHNNLQLAFSNAQVLGQIQTKRQLLLDSSVYGMGRGAGNLPTELIARYIDQNIASRYDVSLVMDVYDQHIADIRKKHQWGYSMAYHIAAVHVCHPNYASFLLEKRDLPVKDMEAVLQSIPETRRAVYDPDLIRRLYHQFQERQIDDSQTVERLARVLRQRRLLLLGGGESLAEKRREIGDFIQKEQPFVVSVNFWDDAFPTDACFVSSRRCREAIRRQLAGAPGAPQAILTSNLPEEEGALFVDYASCLNGDAAVADAPGLMLLRLLKRCGASQVYLAGFDGVRAGTGCPLGFACGLEGEREDLRDRQRRIRKQLGRLGLQIIFLTPSAYEDEED